MPTRRIALPGSRSTPKRFETYLLTLGLDALPYSTSYRVFRGASIYPRSRVFHVPPHATGVEPCGLYGPPAQRRLFSHANLASPSITRPP
jgi:hypothetical protein